MAKLTDLPKELRLTASRMKHLERMPAEEARHRAGHIQGLEQRSPVTGEYQQLVLAHTSRLLASLPVAEYLASIRHLNEMASASPGGGIDSPAHGFRAAASKLKSEHVYPPGLVDACERRLLGKDPMFEADIDAILFPRSE